MPTTFRRLAPTQVIACARDDGRRPLAQIRAPRSAGSARFTPIGGYDLST